MIVFAPVERISKEITRPADTTAYTAGDVISNSTSATTLIEFDRAVRQDKSPAVIVGASVVTNKVSITPRIRLHFYRASDPTVAADNAAFVELYTDVAKKIGYVDLPAMTSPASTSGAAVSRTPIVPLSIPVDAGSKASIYCVLETLDGCNADSGQKFTVTLWVEPRQ